MSYNQQQAARGTSTLQRWIKLGLGSYLVFGLGTAVSMFLFASFAPGSDTNLSTTSPVGSTAGGSAELFAGFFFGFAWLLFFGAGLATVLGLFIGRTTEHHESGPVISAIANGTGTLGAAVVLLLLVVIFAPDGGTDGLFGDFLGPAIGVAIGAAITGAAAATLGERSKTL